MFWTPNDMPDLGGKTFVVIGANSELGLEASRAFARSRARVVLACRNVEKAEAARNDVLGSAPGADVEVRPLDLASLASVRRSPSLSCRATDDSTSSATTRGAVAA